MSLFLKHFSSDIQEAGIDFLNKKRLFEDDNNGDPLGITPKNGEKKVEFDPEGSQKHFEEYVSYRADHIPETGYARGEVKDFDWKYVRDFTIQKLAYFKNWEEWFNGEMSEWEHDHGDERKGHFERWADNPYSKPVILIEGTDGKLHVWDGHHRIGISFKLGKKTVPALLGKRL